MTAKTQQPAETETTLFIPLNRLKKSPKNVRKTPHPQADIEALAASIRSMRCSRSRELGAGPRRHRGHVKQIFGFTGPEHG
jgi:hypothetical protein